MDRAPSQAATNDLKAPRSLPDGAASITSSAGDFFFTDASGNRLRQLDAVESVVHLQSAAAGNSPTLAAIVETANLNRTSLRPADDASGALSPAGTQNTRAGTRPAAASPAAVPAAATAAPGLITDALRAGGAGSEADRIFLDKIDVAADGWSLGPAMTSHFLVELPDGRIAQFPNRQDAETAFDSRSIPPGTPIFNPPPSQPAPTTPAGGGDPGFINTLGAALSGDPTPMDAGAVAAARADLNSRIRTSTLTRTLQNDLTAVVQAATTPEDFAHAESELARFAQLVASQSAGVPTDEQLAQERETAKASLQRAIDSSSLPSEEKERLVRTLGGVVDAASMQTIRGQIRAALTAARPAAAAATPPPASPATPVAAAGPAIRPATPTPAAAPAAAATPAAAPIPGRPATPAAAPGVPVAPIDAVEAQALRQDIADMRQTMAALQAQLAGAVPPTPTATGVIGNVAPQVGSIAAPIGFAPIDPQPDHANGIVGVTNQGYWWVQSPNGTYYRYANHDQAVAASLRMNGTGGIAGGIPGAPIVAAAPLAHDPAQAITQLATQHAQAEASLQQAGLAALTAEEELRMRDPNVSAHERAALSARYNARHLLEQERHDSAAHLQRIRDALAQQGAAVLAAAPTPAVAAQAARGVRSIRQILAGEENRLGTLKYIFNMQNAYVIAAGAAAGAAVTGLAVATGGAAIPVMYAAMAAGGAGGFARTFAEKRRAKQVLLDAAGRETDARRENLLREEANALSVRDNLGTLVFNTMLGGAAGGAMNRVLEWTGARDFMAAWWAGNGPSGRTAAVAGATAGGVVAPSGRVAGTIVSPARPITTVPVAPRGPVAAIVTAPRPRVLGSSEWIMGRRGELIIPGYGQPQQCGIDVHGRKVLAQLGNGSTVLDTITKERSWGTPRCLAALRGQFDIAFRHPSGPRMAGIFVENYQGRTTERAVVPGAVVDTLSTVRGRATTVVPGIDMTPTRPPGALRDAAQVLIGTNSPDPLGRLMARAGIDGYATELLFKGDAPLKGIVGRGRLELIDTIRGILTRDPNLVKEMFPGHPNPVSLIRSGDITFTTGGRMNMNVFKNPQFIDALVRAIEQSKQGVLPASITTDFGGNNRAFAEAVSSLLSRSPRPRLAAV